MQVTITQITRTPRVSKKTGKPFVSVSIKTQEHGDKYLSGFASLDNADWEVGDTVEVQIEQKGEYLNFTTKEKKAAPSEEKLDKILNNQTAMNIKLNLIAEHLMGKKKETEYPENDFPEDSPF